MQNLKEDIVNNLKQLLLTENRESKNMSKARNLLYQQGYSQENAQKTIEAIRNDIPNARLADCKFLLGVTRMYLNGELSDGNTIMKLNKTLKYVASDAHVNEYDNNLNGMSVNDLVQRFAGVQQQDADASRAESYSKQHTRNNAYRIVRIPDFKTAAKYGDYTSWCVTYDENMYNSYTNDSTGLFYFCLRDGFENEQPITGKGCPLDSYGLSMIAVSVTMDGELNTCTCRWNHDNGGNDNIMDKNQLEELLGVNFYEKFKPYSRDELHAKGVILFDEVQDLLDSGKRPEEMFDNVKGFVEGFAVVKLNNKCNYINKEGKILSTNQWFDWCGCFSEGFGVIELNGKYNYINKEGKILSLNRWFERCCCFSEGFGSIKLHGKWNYINKDCKIIYPNQWFDWCGEFSEGFTSIELNGKFNFINKDGKILSPNKWFDWCGEFSEGYAVVKLNNKYNYINKEGVLYDYDTKEPLSNQSLNENLKKDIVNGLKQDLIKARKEVNTKPTEAQIKAENYKMGHIKIMGFDITIENPKNSYRQGVDPNGKKWKTKMYYDYGYFKHTLGKDGDAIDVFIGDNLKSDKIFVVDQFLNGKFDESKVMLGFNTEKEAKEGYLKNYEKDWKGFKKITEVPIDVFKEWLYDGYKQRKAFYQYSDIQKKKLNEGIKPNSQIICQDTLFENLKLNWWEKCIEKYQKNGKIKLYHNTTKRNLNDILLSEELDVKMKHTEGHGDMLFFTTNPESWGNQCKISIEVPIDKFGNKYNDFNFINNIDVIYRNNISTKDFNFKIEKVGCLNFNEIVDKIKNDDDYINQYLSWDEIYKDYINLGISNWFYDLVWGSEQKTSIFYENKQTSTKDVFDKVEKWLNFKNNSNLKLFKVQCIRDKQSNKVHYIAEIYGGLNGNSEWTEYLDDIQYILLRIKDSWVVDLSCDCADDVWTLKVGFMYPSTINEGCWGYEWYDSDQALDECSAFAKKMLSWLCDSIRKKLNKKDRVYTDYIYGYLGMIRELLNTEEIFRETLTNNDRWFELRAVIRNGCQYCINNKDTYEDPKKLEKKINALRDELEKLLNNKYTKESKREINEKVEYRFTLNEIKNRKNEEGNEVPQKCEECGSDVVLKIEGEPIFICSNEKCKKYYGVLPFSSSK